MKYDMVRLFNSDTHGRYVKTFVLLTLNGEARLCWFHSLEENTALFFICPSMEKVLVNRKTLLEGHAFLEAFLPSAGWYQYDRVCFYLMGRPQRQWKRSLCGTTHTVFSPMFNLRISTDYPQVIAVLTEKQPTLTLEKAGELLKQKEFIGCKLNECFAITQKGVIYNNNVQVGKMDFNRQKLDLNPLFKDEFSTLADGVLFT